MGFNNERFDYEVLKAYTPFDFRKLPTFDLLQEIYQSTTSHWQLLLGSTIVLLVLFLPGGISSVTGRLRRALVGGV